MSNKKRRADNEGPPLPVPLSHVELDALTVEVNSHQNAIINYLSNEKDTTLKTKLKTAVGSFCDAFHRLSTAYTFLLGRESTADVFRSDLLKIADSVESTKVAVNDLSQSVSNAAAVQDKSYASAVKQASSHLSSKPSNKMHLANGKTLPIGSDSQIFIGPIDPASNTLNTSTATKACFLEHVKPTDLGLRISRLHFGPNNSIILEGDPRNSELLNDSTLQQAGLERKDSIKKNPRIIVYDIPCSLDKEEILTALNKQNFPDFSRDEFKVVYLFPVRAGKKSRSCILEISPACRKLVCSTHRIYIGLRSCRCADHISIVQCYNCNKFGHVAKDCKQATCCGFCGLAHPTKDCSNKTALSCVNCKESGHITNHAAHDRVKCPLFRAKLLQRSSLINYDE